jgi:hypothetical protein
MLPYIVSSTSTGLTITALNSASNFIFLNLLIVLIVVVDLEILKSENEGEWLNVRNLGKEEIITALNWFSVLLGQATPGKLGQTQEIRNTYNLAMNTVINPEQANYLSTFKSIFSFLGYSDDIQFKNITPFDYSDTININKLLTKREGLELLGLPVDELRTDLNEIIDNGNNNSIGNKE